MINLGFSVNSIQSILSKDSWVAIYQEELCERLVGLEKTQNNFVKGNFVELIKPQLERIFENKLSEFEIRELIRKWLMIVILKSNSLIKLLEHIPNELNEADKVYKKYSDVTLGPIDCETVDKMSSEQKIKWHEGSIITFYAATSVKNLLGIYASELFFTFEALCRVICNASCLEYAVKVFIPNAVVQHNEIYKTLRKLSGENSNNVGCKLCPICGSCFNKDFLKIASIYEVFYHIRAIKDYREEFYDNVEFQIFLRDDYLQKSFKALCIADNITNDLLKNYLRYPLTIAETREKVSTIQKNW
jgi:hypothetical protein